MRRVVLVCLVAFAAYRVSAVWAPAPEYRRATPAAEAHEGRSPDKQAPAQPTTDARRALDTSALTYRLDAIVAKAGADLSLVVEDLSSGFRYEHRPRVRMPSASLVKVPIAVAVYEAIEAGRLAPDAALRYRKRHYAGGSGLLKHETPGRKVPLRELLRLSLAASDNVATNILAEAVGPWRVNDVARKYFGPVTDYRRKVMDLAARDRGVENWTTAEEMAGAFARLYRGEVVSPEASKALLQMMSDTRIDDRLLRYLPENVQVSHKTGLLKNVVADCGILYLPGDRPVVVAALARVRNRALTEKKRLIAEVGRAVYEAAVPPEAWAPPRRND